LKTVVIYKSKSGFTKEYANWIAQELSADIFEVTNMNSEILIDYDTIIYGGGLYAVGINGVELITQSLEKLKGKKVVVFATGASECKDEVVKEVCNKNFTLEQQKQIRFFYLRGGFNFSKLKPIDKVLMTLMKWKMKMKHESKLSPDEIGMLAAYDHPEDHTTKENMNALIDFVTLSESINASISQTS